MTDIDRFTAWCQRAHARAHHREPGTNGTEDNGCNAGCTDSCEWARDPERGLSLARERAREGHAKFAHPGPVDACQSPHDVLCKAVW